MSLQVCPFRKQDVSFASRQCTDKTRLDKFELYKMRIVVAGKRLRLTRHWMRLRWADRIGQ